MLDVLFQVLTHQLHLCIHILTSSTITVFCFSCFLLLCLELGQASSPACSAGFSPCIECKNRVIRAFSRSRLCRLTTAGWHPGSLPEGIAHAGTDSRHTFSCLSLVLLIAWEQSGWSILGNHISCSMASLPFCLPGAP